MHPKTTADEVERRVIAPTRERILGSDDSADAAVVSPEDLLLRREEAH